MATAEIAIDAATPRRRRKPLRYFFVGMAVFALALLALTFVPEYRRFAGGSFEIARVLHVHAAIMAAWVAGFAVQAWLGATGQTTLHRRVGPYVVGIGALAWVSMIFVEFRGMVVHPIPQDLSEYDWNLPGPFTYLTFPIYVAWAAHERCRPAWHKRLMTFALFLTLGAAFQRYHWIPMDFGYWPFAAAIDATLLIPLAAYDLSMLKGRLHPATVRGTSLLLASEMLLFELWGTDLWRHFASWVTHSMHG